MTSLRRTLRRQKTNALRGAVKLDVNRLIVDPYVSSSLPVITRAPVKGVRGQSGDLSSVDPDA